MDENSIKVSDNLNIVDCKADACVNKKNVITRAVKLMRTSNNDHRSVARGTSWYSDCLDSTILLIYVSK